MKIPRVHLFTCVGKQCKNSNPEAIMDRLREVIKQRGLEDVTSTSSGCVHLCDLGPVMFVYPGSVWYVGVQPDDVEKIVENHVIQGRAVERLRMTPSHPEELRRKAFYGQLLGKDFLSKEEIMEVAGAAGFSQEWVELQITTGFFEPKEENQPEVLKLASKARSRYA